MKNDPSHTLELYSREVFQVLLEYEINRSRRYPNSITLLNIFIKAEPNVGDVQVATEKVITDILNANLRGADIPSKTGNEYLILLPTTDESGGRVVCERLLSLLKRTFQTASNKMFSIAAYVGMATMEGSAVSAATLISQSARALSSARAQGLSTYTVFEEKPTS